jgi:hypothetical protein
MRTLLGTVFRGGYWGALRMRRFIHAPQIQHPSRSLVVTSLHAVCFHLHPCNGRISSLQKVGSITWGVCVCVEGGHCPLLLRYGVVATRQRTLVRNIVYRSRDDVWNAYDRCYIKPVNTSLPRGIMFTPISFLLLSCLVVRMLQCDSKCPCLWRRPFWKLLQLEILKHCSQQWNDVLRPSGIWHSVV